MDAVCTDGVSREDAKIYRENSDLDVGGRELKYLGADMLVKVLSYLPLQEIFEVLLVSKDWNSAVMEGSVLWRKVDVCQEWNLDGESCNTGGNEILRRVLGFAEDVTFSEAFKGDEKHVMSVGEWLGPNLRILKLPSQCISPSFFSLLSSNCPLLESLVVEGSLALPSGSDPIHIQHQRLKSLALFWRIRMTWMMLMSTLIPALRAPCMLPP